MTRAKKPSIREATMDALTVAHDIVKRVQDKTKTKQPLSEEERADFKLACDVILKTKELKLKEALQKREQPPQNLLSVLMQIQKLGGVQRADFKQLEAASPLEIQSREDE